MKEYEALCVIKANLAEEKVNSLLSRFEKKIADNGGELVKIEKMGQRRLPFRIQKHKSEKEGQYVLIKFKGVGATPNALKEEFRVQEEVIRQMITLIPEEDKVLIEEPSEQVEQEASEEVSGQPQ